MNKFERRIQYQNPVGTWYQTLQAKIWKTWTCVIIKKVDSNELISYFYLNTRNGSITKFKDQIYINEKQKGRNYTGIN